MVRGRLATCGSVIHCSDGNNLFVPKNAIIFMPIVDIGRGLKSYDKFTTQYHGEMLVQDSSAAMDICGWVFTTKAYSNTPDVNPPHLHLTLEDAIKLRNALTLFIDANS